MLLESDVPSPYAHQRLSPAPSLFAAPGNHGQAKPPAARARPTPIRVHGEATNGGQGKPPPQRVPRPGSAPGRPSLKGAGSAVIATKRIRRVSAGDVTSGVSAPLTPLARGGGVRSPPPRSPPKLEPVDEGRVSPPSAVSPPKFAPPHQASPGAAPRGRVKPAAERKRRNTAPDVLNARPGARPVASPIKRSDQQEEKP